MGRDRPKNEIGPAPAQKGKPSFYKAGLSSPREKLAQLIIFPLLQNVNCSRSACKGGQQRRGDREGEKITWNEGSWLLSPVIAHGGARWRQAVALLSFLLLPRAEAPAAGFFLFSPASVLSFSLSLRLSLSFSSSLFPGAAGDEDGTW
jgi:hypothetical protein